MHKPLDNTNNAVSATQKGTTRQSTEAANETKPCCTSAAAPGEPPLCLGADVTLDAYLPDDPGDLSNMRKAIPRIARDRRVVDAVEGKLRQVPTHHSLWQADARDLACIPSDSVQLILTSPPYWNLKAYNDVDGQLGRINDYEAFVSALAFILDELYRVLVPGGRLVIVVGDVALARRQNKGRHVVVPLHATIQESCREIGFDNLAPIIWNKIGNARYESVGAGFYGTPYEPNGIIKNEIEYLLFQRKPGGYRTRTDAARILSVISQPQRNAWLRQVWTDIPGVARNEHPAPFPEELAERLVRMFSFVGDTVLDPFLGSGTTSVAAARFGRNSLGCDIDGQYLAGAVDRLEREARSAAGQRPIAVHTLEAMTTGDSTTPGAGSLRLDDLPPVSAGTQALN